MKKFYVLLCSILLINTSLFALQKDYTTTLIYEYPLQNTSYGCNLPPDDAPYTISNFSNCLSPFPDLDSKLQFIGGTYHRHYELRECTEIFRPDPYNDSYFEKGINALIDWSCTAECSDIVNNNMQIPECPDTASGDNQVYNSSLCECIVQCTPPLPPDGKSSINYYDGADAESQCYADKSSDEYLSHYSDMECVPQCPDPITGYVPYVLFANSIPTCQEPNTEYPDKANNENILFIWSSDSNRSNECSELSGIVQSKITDCKKEYRCVKEIKEDECSRNQHVNSYISPTDRTYHEDIDITGSDIKLHYKSEISSNSTIAKGWSLSNHHKLVGSYLHLGNGKVLSVKDNVLSNENELYIFNENNLHVNTLDIYTNKVLQTFSYDSSNQLVSISDRFNNVTILNRDTNSTLLSIVSPYGHITYIDIDADANLLKVEYEDGSSYSFEYNENHKMTKEIDPNNNAFIHNFDNSGKVLNVIDAEDGKWQFSNTKLPNYFETSIHRAEGDILTYQDFYLNQDDLLSQSISPSGEIYSSVTKVDGLTKVKSHCSQTTQINYKNEKDPLSNENLLDSITVTTPSGLTKTTNYSQNYTFDGNNTLLSKQSIIETNGATVINVRDYNNSTASITSAEGRSTLIEYNPNTLLPIKMQYASLKPIIIRYDKKGRVKKLGQGARQVKYIYDKKGNIKEKINLQRDTSKLYTYDIKNRVTQVTLENGKTINYVYNANGNKTRLTTPRPSDFEFTYNGIDKRTGITSPLGYNTSYEYDKQRRLTKLTRPSGKSITNNYSEGRLTKVTTPDAISNYTYTCGDKLESISQNSESINYGYDGDLLTSLTQSGILNQNINYTYNNNFYIASINYSGSTNNYTYDNDGLLTSSGAFNITRDTENGLVTNISDGVLSIYKTYNKFGEIKTKKSQSFKLTLKRKEARVDTKIEKVVNLVPNKKGTKLKKQRIINEYNYTYDELSRLTQVGKNGEVFESYTYDVNGNRVSATVNGVTTSAYYTLDDQTEVYGDDTYTYNEDGQLVSKQSSLGTTTYTYNTYGTLTGVTLEDGTTIKYHLNPLNQRVAKEVNGQITEKYLWADLTTLLAIYDGNDNLVQRYNYSDERVPTSLTQDNQTYYLHYDQVGTLRLVTDKNHNIVKEITYDTYGNILTDTNKEFKVPFGFAGALQDRDTNLVHFGHREYDPYTAKWTTKDPIDFSGGDTNLYGYVLNDPVNFVDPSGLAGMSEIGVGIGLLYTGYEWYDAIDNLHDKAEMAKLCRKVYDQLDYDRDSINKSCISTENKLDLLRKSAKSEKELFKVCAPYLGIGN